MATNREPEDADEWFAGWMMHLTYCRGAFGCPFCDWSADEPPAPAPDAGKEP